MIYADNAATTKMSEKAVQAMITVIREDYGNPSSLYSIGQKAKETLEEARKTVADVIGAKPQEILFTSVPRRSWGGRAGRCISFPPPLSTTRCCIRWRS